MTATTVNYEDANAPWVPSFLYPEGPHTCPCGHHEGYHAHSGACRYTMQCRCTGLPPECFTPVEGKSWGAARP